MIMLNFVCLHPVPTSASHFPMVWGKGNGCCCFVVVRSHFGLVGVERGAKHLSKAMVAKFGHVFCDFHYLEQAWASSNVWGAGGALGPTRLDAARLGSTGLDWARLRLDWARLGSTRLESARTFKKTQNPSGKHFAPEDALSVVSAFANGQNFEIDCTGS